MGTVLLTCLFGVLLLLLVWRLLDTNVLGRNQSASRFEHFVRSLIVLMENGGYLTVKRRKSDVSFRLQRVSGVENSALIRVEIPRAPWSDAALPALKDAFSREKVDFRHTGAETALEPNITIDLPVDDIWRERAGSEGARVAHVVLRAASIPSDARFDLDLIGARSNRMSRHYRKLREERKARRKSSLVSY